MKRYRLTLYVNSNEDYLVHTFEADTVTEIVEQVEEYQKCIMNNDIWYQYVLEEAGYIEIKRADMLQTIAMEAM